MKKKMNLLQKAVARVTRIPLDLSGDNFAYNEHMANRAVAGQKVNASSAQGISATWANVNLLASTVGSTPLDLYRQEGKNKVRETGHALSSLLSISPHDHYTPLEYWEYAQGSLELKGDFFAEIKRGVRGDVVSLNPLGTEGVTIHRKSIGALRYKWIDPLTHVHRDEPASNIVHIRTRLGPDGMRGMSTLEACRSIFGVAQATNKSVETMFANGARPSGVLSTDLPLDKKEREKLEKLLQEKFTGAMNHNRPMLLDNKLTWQQLSMSGADSQMLESRRFTVEEVCLIFGVPPHMIGYTAGAAVSKTLTEQTHGFQKYTLRPRYKRIEQALERQLLTLDEREKGLKIRFNLEALLRGVPKERSAFYSAGLKDAWLTVNEVRALEGLKPVKGGDVPRTQMQNVPLTETGSNNPKGDQS